MDGIHDLGGRQGFGPVEVTSEPVGFSQRWHARVFACMRALGAAGVVRNTDQFRHAIERIDPVAYLTHGYYGRWLGGLETLMIEAGLITAGQLDELSGQPEASAARPGPGPLVAAEVLTDAPAGAARTLRRVPAFQVGQGVRTRTHGPAGHTRLPGYVRGRRGVVSASHDGWVFPDTNAHGLGEQPQHLYTVTFSGEELWGDGAEAGVRLHIDLFEDYLREDVDE